MWCSIVASVYRGWGTIVCKQRGHIAMPINGEGVHLSLRWLTVSSVVHPITISHIARKLTEQFVREWQDAIFSLNTINPRTCLFTISALLRNIVYTVVLDEISSRSPSKPNSDQDELHFSSNFHFFFF